jgi:hypothetical protein
MRVRVFFVVVGVVTLLPHRSIRASTGRKTSPARIDHWNALLRAYAARHRGEVQLADLNAFTAPEHHYANTVNGVRLRYDGVHFEPDAGALVYRWLDPFLSRS